MWWPAATQRWPTTPFPAVILADAKYLADRIEAVAALVVASIEGGFVLARTNQSISSFVAIGEMLSQVIAADLPARAED